jgi:hypothetical protein
MGRVRAGVSSWTGSFSAPASATTVPADGGLGFWGERASHTVVRDNPVRAASCVWFSRACTRPSASLLRSSMSAGLWPFCSSCTCSPPQLMCSPLSIFVRANHGAHRFRDLRPRQHLTVYREPVVAIAVVLLTIALVIVVGLLAAAGAGKLARMDGATYPAAFTRAAITFAAVITLAASVTAALAALLT